MSVSGLLLHCGKAALSSPRISVSIYGSGYQTSWLHLSASYNGSNLMKSKKRESDDAERKRFNRKVRKLKKSIKELELHERKAKPIDELQPHISILNRLNERTREAAIISAEEKEERDLLVKEWCRYQTELVRKERKQIKSMLDAQQKALDELRLVSEEFYQDAIAVDDNLLPYQVQGPVLTPPIDNYVSPDGDYVDISRKFT